MLGKVAAAEVHVVDLEEEVVVVEEEGREVEVGGMQACQGRTSGAACAC